jgi:hypothetical protein
MSRVPTFARWFLGLLMRSAWLGICVTWLVAALHGYRGASDFMVEEALALQMMAVAFPASIAVWIGFAVVGFTLERFGLSLPSSSRPEMIATWLLFAIAGYIQWFVVVPYLIRFLRNARSKRATTENL